MRLAETRPYLQYEKSRPHVKEEISLSGDFAGFRFSCIFVFGFSCYKNLKFYKLDINPEDIGTARYKA